MKPFLYLLAILFSLPCSVVPQDKVFGTKTEEVKLSYDLLLNRCKASACHSESVGHADVYINLEAEDKSYSWGYETMYEHSGNVEYQLRLNVSRVSKEKRLKRGIVLGFSGRIETPAGHQVTWGEKQFSGNNWDSFKMASVSGSPYSEGDETITPTLQVLQIKIFP